MRVRAGSALTDLPSIPQTPEAPEGGAGGVAAGGLVGALMDVMQKRSRVIHSSGETPESSLPKSWPSPPLTPTAPRRRRRGRR